MTIWSIRLFLLYSSNNSYHSFDPFDISSKLLRKSSRASGDSTIAVQTYRLLVKWEKPQRISSQDPFSIYSQSIVRFHPDRSRSHHLISLLLPIGSLQKKVCRKCHTVWKELASISANESENHRVHCKPFYFWFCIQNNTSFVWGENIYSPEHAQKCW